MARLGDNGVIGVVDSPRSDGELAGVDVVAGTELRKDRKVA